MGKLPRSPFHGHFDDGLLSGSFRPRSALSGFCSIRWEITIRVRQMMRWLRVLPSWFNSSMHTLRKF